VLASGGDGQRQLDLLAASISAIMIVFRAFLRLHGEKPPADNAALADTVGRRAGFDPAPFVRVVRHVRGESLIKVADTGAILAGYLQGTEQLVSYLDAYEAPASP
jgi:hypothetical protein